jgi:hypothetical protein
MNGGRRDRRDDDAVAQHDVHEQRQLEERRGLGEADDHADRDRRP